MKVSVITVCKNSEKTIGKSIQSLISQTYKNIEYIIIDGNSEDKTKDIINRYTKHITHFISEPDSGIYQAMNKGIKLATGTFFYFLNSDDYLYDSEVIQDLVKFVSKYPKCDFVYGDNEARFSGISSIHQPALPEEMLEEMICVGRCMIQPASFFRAELFSKLEHFSEKYKIASDYEWFFRLLQEPTVKICYYPRVIVSYSHGGASSNILKLFEEVFEIQNSIPLFQNEDWLKKRMAKLQVSFIEKYDSLYKTSQLAITRQNYIESLETKIANLESTKVNINPLKAKISFLESKIEAMQTSKFWKMRSLWFRFKRLLRLLAIRQKL